MNTKKLLAAVVTTGALCVGTASAAFADASTPVAPPAVTAPANPGNATRTSCTKAPGRLARAQEHVERLNRRIQVLHQADHKARAGNHPKLAARIEARIDRLQRLHDRLADLMTRVEHRCNLPAPTAGTAPSTPLPTTPPTSGAGR